MSSQVYKLSQGEKPEGEEGEAAKPAEAEARQGEPPAEEVNMCACIHLYVYIHAPKLQYIYSYIRPCDALYLCRNDFIHSFIPADSYACTPSV